MTQEAKHTPGPWHCSAYMDSTCLYRIQHNYIEEDERKANARLIAAAPELLEALQGFVKYHDQKSINNKEHALLMKARIPIAKATGQE